MVTKSTFRFRIFLIIVLCCVLCFSSCHIPLFSQLAFYNEDFDIVDKLVEQVAKLIVGKDFNGLSKLLSQKALESDDLEEGFAFSCTIVFEEIIEIESWGHTIPSHIENEMRTKRSDARYKLKSASGKVIYLVIEYWFYNEQDPSLMGINCFRFSETPPNFMELGLKYPDRAGIYNPLWDVEEF